MATNTNTTTTCTTTNIVNVVATGWLGAAVDLHNIAQRLWNVEYNTRRFSAAIHRQRSIRTTVLLFASGRFVCTGARSIADAKQASRQFARKIQKLLGAAAHIRFLDHKIENVVGAMRCNHKISLAEFYAHRQQQCDWKQESFPSGIRYQPHRSNPKLCALVFPSGRCVLTGAKTEAEILELGAEMKRLLLRYRPIIGC